jgi:hypothetical protein
MTKDKNIQILKRLFGCSSFPFGEGRVGASMLFFLLISCLSSSAQFSATFRADSDKIEIGDHLDMKLVVNAGPNIVVDFPSFPGDSIGSIDVVKKSKIDTAKLGGNMIYSQTVTISAYNEGRYFFNPLKIYFLNKTTGVVDSAYTNDWQMTVTTLPVDTTKPIKPIKAPLKVDYTWNEFTWWIVAAVLLLIALIIAFILYRRYKNKPAPVVSRPRPKEPAHIWANKEIKKLEEEKLWQKDEVKQYYSRLADILRLYLEYRFNYYAMEATTEEIIDEVHKREISMDASARLRDTLRLSDFVKFAKMNPAPDQNTKAIQDALAFVDFTKPQTEEILNNNK